MSTAKTLWQKVMISLGLHSPRTALAVIGVALMTMGTAYRVFTTAAQGTPPAPVNAGLPPGMFMPPQGGGSFFPPSGGMPGPNGGSFMPPGSNSFTPPIGGMPNGAMNPQMQQTTQGMSPDQIKMMQNYAAPSPTGGTTTGGGAASQPSAMQPCPTGQMPTATLPCFYNPTGTNSPMPGGANYSQGIMNVMPGGFPGGQNTSGAPGFYQGNFPPGLMYQGMQGNGSPSDEQMKQMQDDRNKRMAEETKQRSTEECGRLAQVLDYPNVSGDAKTKVQSLVDQCKSAAGAIDPANPGSFYETVNGLHQQLGSLLQNSASCDGVQSFIHGMEQGAEDASGFIEQTRKNHPDLAQQMEGMRVDTLAAVDTAKQQVQSGDCQSAQQTMQAMQSAHDQAMRSWGNSGPSFVNTETMTRDFASNLSGKGANVSADDLKRQGLTDAKDFDIMSKLMTFGGKDFAKGFTTQGDNTANVVNSLRAVDASSDQTAMMAQMMAENQRLKAQIADLTQKLNAVQSQLVTKLGALTPDSTIALQIQDYVKNQLPENGKMTADQAEKVYEGFKLANGQLLVQKGVVTNPDIDPSDWHAQYVSAANKTGIMKGDPSGLFRPDAKMNEAEAVVTLARSLGVTMEAGAEPTDQKFAHYPSWSKAAIAALEKEGIDLGALDEHADAPISKAQLADLVATMIPDEAVKGQIKAFTDLKNKVDPATQAAIEKLAGTGIVSGEGNGTTFNPDGDVNRAIGAKMFTNAINVAKKALLGDGQGQATSSVSSAQTTGASASSATR